MTKINKNTQQHLDFFTDAGVTAFDVAARNEEFMQLRENKSIEELIHLMKWLMRENANGAEIQIRPHRHDQHRLLFFDDVEKRLAVAVSQKYSACIIETSKEGGCHIWLQADKVLNERQRYLAQRYLQPKIKSDKGSISGEHFGRLAGFTNHKRNRQWVNVIAVSNVGAWQFIDEAVKEDKQSSNNIAYTTSSRTRIPKNIITGTAISESEMEWGYICGKLEHGTAPDELIDELEKRARARGKDSPHRYAETTVRKALAYLSR